MFTYAEKSVDHKEGSLGFLVNNLVKNWEKEASYKLKGGKILPHTLLAYNVDLCCLSLKLDNTTAKKHAIVSQVA